MGDVMLFGILRMPYDMAMENEISRHQYWQSGQQAAQEIERLREALLSLMKVQNGPPLTAWTNDWLEAMKKADAALQQKEPE